MLAPRSMLHSVRGECELLPLAEHWVEAGIPWWWRSEVLGRIGGDAVGCGGSHLFGAAADELPQHGMAAAGGCERGAFVCLVVVKRRTRKAVVGSTIAAW